MTSSTRAYAEVIGDPIAQSKSPAIHNFWLGELAIDAEYRAVRVERGALAAYVEERRGDRLWRGTNVTMPLKLDALAIADDATDRAVAAGAANLLVPREGRLMAANTDVGAIVRLLERERTAGRRMGSVTLFGNGGAARAALVALKLLGIDLVRIQARDRAAATKLAVEFGLSLAPAPLTAPVDSDALINATPLGMTTRECLNCDLALLPEQGLVFDMVTAPPETPLIAAARQRGLAVVTGVDMLVEQAAASFKLMFDADPPRNRDDALFALLGA